MTTPLTRSKARLSPHFKLWLSSARAQGVFGDGKWRLLRAIRDHGSLVTAARTLGISYRKAWGDLKKAERHLGVALLEKRRGGNDGGATRLTPAGTQWVDAYERFRDEVESAIEQGFDRHIRTLDTAGRTGRRT